MMKKLITTGALVLLGAAGIQTVHAAKIYACTVNGSVVYTSRPSGSCQTADLPAIGRYSSSRYQEPQAALQAERQEVKKQAVAKARTPKPAAQEGVMPAKLTQPAAPKLAGNSGRRSILEQELANERKALAEVQQSLTSARAAKDGSINQQQITQLQGSVLDRQQNIQALQRELARM